MKGSLSRGKLTVYQDYRNRAQSDLNTSQILPDLSELNQLDHQVREYQQKREMKNSHSELELQIHREGVKTGSVVKQKAMIRQNNQNRTERNNHSALTTIVEVGQTRQRPTRNNGLTTHSTMFMQSPKSRGIRTLQSKAVNAHSKQKEVNKQKSTALKLKTKQLQQEYIQLLMSDPQKKAAANRQFTALLKLLD